MRTSYSSGWIALADRVWIRYQSYERLKNGRYNRTLFLYRQIAAMSSITILDSKFNLKALLEAYLSDVKQISTTGLTPAELKSRQHYIDAITVIQRVGITDMVKFALSFGREKTGDAKLLESALPTLVCWHVHQPNAMDKKYAAILYEYAVSFKANRRNLKDILLGFALNSSLSPIKPYFDRELDNVIRRSKSFH